MTREEAKELLTHVLMTYEPRDQYGDLDDPQPYEEAITMAIEALQQVTGKLSNPDVSLLTADDKACKESKSKLDLISRADAVKPFCIAPDGTRIPEVDCDNFPVEFSVEFIKKHLLSLPSAEPKTGTVLCALAERVCTFQGKAFAWCLTCPHISEEDRNLVKKTVSEPKTGEWLEVEVFPEVYDIEGVKTWGSGMQCDQCGFRFTAIEGHIRQYNYCPNCGSYNGGEEE